MWQCIKRCLAGLGVNHIRFHEGDVANTLTLFGYIMLFLSGQKAMLFPLVLFRLSRYHGDLAFIADDHAALRVRFKQAVKVVHIKE
jgi:hypothetical protein